MPSWRTTVRGTTSRFGRSGSVKPTLRSCATDCAGSATRGAVVAVLAGLFAARFLRLEAVGASTSSPARRAPDWGAGVTATASRTSSPRERRESMGTWIPAGDRRRSVRAVRLHGVAVARPACRRNSPCSDQRASGRSRLRQVNGQDDGADGDDDQANGVDRHGHR